MINQAVLDKIKPGATVRVFETVTEVEKKGKSKGKERTRKTRFEGLVIARKHGNEAGATFTVRATMGGVGIEKVFPINMQTIDKVEVISSPRKVKKAKLYYMENLSRKALRKKLSTVFRRGASVGDAASAVAVADTVGEDEEVTPVENKETVEATEVEETKE